MADELPPEPARKLFTEIAEEIAAAEGAGSAHRKGFGTGSMFVGRKMFAVLDTTGDLVIKLPPERVKELIAAKSGRPWHPGNGVPLKEYVAVSYAQRKRWSALAREARTYMESKG